MSNFIFYDFIKPAFESKKQNVIVRAGRRSGKTFGAVQKICLNRIKRPYSKGLWVDTVQGNIAKYIDRYFRPILGDLWESIDYDKQKQILQFANGSYIDFGSAERPENLEGFGYDDLFLNEAGLILKKEGLWERTLKPMALNAQTFFIGTPKGKTGHKYYELSQLALTNENWVDFHYPAIKSPEYTQEVLDEIQATSPAYLYAQEYLAEFVDLYENSMLSPEDITYYDFVSLNDFEKIYIHADTTHTAKTTSDYFALVAIAENVKDKKYYVLDYVLDKIDVETQARQLIHLFTKYDKKVSNITFDEKANNGFGFWCRKLAREEYNISLPLEELKYPSDKVTHFEPHYNHFKSKRVLLPRSHPKIALAVDQLLAFPNKSTNDDFVDGISGCLDNYLVNKRKIRGVVLD